MQELTPSMHRTSEGATQHGAGSWAATSKPDFYITICSHTCASLYSSSKPRMICLEAPTRKKFKVGSLGVFMFFKGLYYIRIMRVHRRCKHA